jgi:hypothetical protein
MDNMSWIDERQQRSDKHGGEFRRVISRIKRGLAQDRLSSIKVATHHLHDHPGAAPKVVARLNNLARHSSLSFRWFPGDHNESGKLLIRNQSVGLVIKTAPDSASEAIMMTPEKETPFCSLEPEAALSLLSSQARSQTVISKMPHHRRPMHLLPFPTSCPQTN